MAVETFIKADNMRNVAKLAKIRAQEEFKQHIMSLDLYKKIVADIRLAAADGNNSITMMPKEREYYDNLLDDHKIFPEEARLFTPEYEEVANALRDFGGFHTKFESIPVIYDDMGSSTRVHTLSIYW